MSIFQDTAFGKVLRLVSGGRVLGWQELHDQKLREQYMRHGLKKRSDSSEEEMEKGNEVVLIDFLDDDPQVGVQVSSK